MKTLEGFLAEEAEKRARSIGGIKRTEWIEWLEELRDDLDSYINQTRRPRPPNHRSRPKVAGPEEFPEGGTTMTEATETYDQQRLDQQRLIERAKAEGPFTLTFDEAYFNGNTTVYVGEGITAVAAAGGGKPYLDEGISACLRSDADALEGVKLYPLDAQGAAEAEADERDEREELMTAAARALGSLSSEEREAVLARAEKIPF